MLAECPRKPGNEKGDFERGMVLDTVQNMSAFQELAIDDDTTDELAAELNQIYQRAQRETLALFKSRATETVIVPAQEWMTATQLAEYWQLYNDKNEPTTAGILKWAKRPLEQFPLPHAYMGDLLRFNRDEVDLWAHEEAERRRVQNEKRRLRIV